MNFDDTARFFGSSKKLWPELFIAPSKAMRLSRDCRKVIVEGIRRYCGRCALRTSWLAPANLSGANKVLTEENRKIARCRWGTYARRKCNLRWWTLLQRYRHVSLVLHWTRLQRRMPSVVQGHKAQPCGLWLPRYRKSL